MYYIDIKVYIALTDGPHPAHFIALTLNDPDSTASSSNNIEHYTLNVPVLSRPLVSPIGAGDATSSGFLMSWSDRVKEIGTTQPTSSSSSTSSSPTTLKGEVESEVEQLLQAFRWGLSCGGASCMETGNSVFSMSDAMHIYHNIFISKGIDIDVVGV